MDLRPMLLPVLALAGCYAPDLADCTVACNAADDCAADQVCAEGQCRAPAARCEGAPATVALQVEVAGPGQVVIGGVGTCASPHADADPCAWRIPVGTELHLEARPFEDKELDKWTTAACAGQDASCTVIASDAVFVGAKFH